MIKWIIQNGFPPIFQVLCYNCNILKHRESRVSRTRYATYQENLKREVLAHYSGGSPSCAKCAVSDIRVLTIEHLNGGGNRHRLSLSARVGGHELYHWLRRNCFPGGYGVLCFNHNAGRVNAP